MKSIYSILLLVLICTAVVHGQDGFQWRTEKSKIEIPFQHVYNLIVIPVEINNVKLEMLLDSGSERSMIFSLPENDSIQFDNTKKIKVRGLGVEESIEALFSEKNKIKINGYEDLDFPLLIILNQEINFSSRLGIPVHGILGYSFFQNNIVEINYVKKVVTIHRDRDFLNKRKFRRYEKLPFEIIDDRPFLNVETTIGDDTHNLKLLIDIGLSDGLWIFENDKIKSQKVYIEEVLGRGLSGEIIGKKSRVDAIKLADFRFEEPLVSYPYYAYFEYNGLLGVRNGSIGGEILSRFRVIFDNEEKQLLLKKNSKFEKPFNYNMSGITVRHNGLEYVQETVKLATTTNYGKTEENSNNTIYIDQKFKYNFVLKPIFEIADVRKDSPAAIAGLLAEDKIIKINKKSVHDYSLQRINDLLQSEEGRWVTIEVERKLKTLVFKFRLKKMI